MYLLIENKVRTCTHIQPQTFVSSYSSVSCRTVLSPSVCPIKPSLVFLTADLKAPSLAAVEPILSPSSESEYDRIRVMVLELNGVVERKCVLGSFRTSRCESCSGTPPYCLDLDIHFFLYIILLQSENRRSNRDSVVSTHRDMHCFCCAPSEDIELAISVILIHCNSKKTMI